MPLIMNGTEIQEVWANGVRCDEVHMNGVEVYRRAFMADITLSGESFNFHLNNHLLTLGWDEVLPVDCTITVTGHVGSGSNAFAAFYILELTAGSEVKVIVAPSGSISGGGGRGADTEVNPTPPPGDPGGDGMVVLPQLAGTVVRVQNDGIIAGGGGGGGGWASPYSLRAGGGGGAGRVPGSGGSSLGLDAPAAGTALFGGSGVTSIYGDPANSSGRGGNLGEPGQAGTSSDPANAVSAGGAAGRAVVGTNNITWDKVGTTYGALV